MMKNCFKPTLFSDEKLHKHKIHHPKNNNAFVYLAKINNLPNQKLHPYNENCSLKKIKKVYSWFYISYF